MNYERRFQRKEAAIQYEKIYKRQGTFDAIIWEIEKCILDHIIQQYIPSSCRLTYLDFACGTGRVLSYMEKRFQHAFGIDVSPHMTDLAKQKTKGAKIIVGDVTKNPSLLPGPFDAITAFRFFLNVEGTLRPQILMELKKRMHARSILILNNHGSQWSLRSLTIRLKRKLERDDVSEIHRRQFEAMLRRCGFDIVERFGVAILTPWLCNMLGPRITRLIEQAGYRTKLARWLGSNQIYAVRITN